MTYFTFLALFLGIPILILSAVLWLDWRRGLLIASSLRTHPPLLIVLIHVLIALVYTTPWDNYLVATAVWWYDPALVNGFTIGWVPIEEYTFFVVQPILTGLWLIALARRLPLDSPNDNRARLRHAAVLATAVVWLGAVILLVVGWEPATYLSLELGWALPPIILQLFFGADILWRQRRLVLPALLIPTLYLSAADAVAIEAGTWTINPAQSLNVYLGGVLPVEEFLFFLLTNTLITFGVTLALDRQSQERFAAVRRWLAPLSRRLARDA